MLLGGVVVVFLILLSAGGVAVWYIQNMDDIALEGTVPEDDVAAGEEAAEEPAIPPADEEPPLAPGEARFTVTHPNPKKLVVSCGGDSVSGVNSARLVASLESTCSVKFIASDRSRNTTKVKFFPGEWACFANDSDECVNPDVPVEVPEPTAADGEQAVTVAVNPDPGESNIEALDPEEMLSSIRPTGEASTRTAALAAQLTPADKAVLMSFGIESAADCTEEKLARVPALRKKIVKELIKWRDSLDKSPPQQPKDKGADNARIRLDREMDIKRATVLIGVRDLANIVLEEAVIRHYKHLARHGFDLEALWRHTILTARLCRELAAGLRDPAVLGSVSPADCYTCGLLHDLGQVVLLRRRERPHLQRAVGCDLE